MNEVRTDLNNLKKEIDTTKEDRRRKSIVATSKEWDARKAGREIGVSILEKLGCEPDFIILFSSIHYKDYGGFKELLNGIWDILPGGIPLIGGTVAGFINPQGCHTRGVTALACSCKDMDIAVAYADNVRKNPKKSGEYVSKEIKEKLEVSKRKNRLIIQVVAGSKEPKLMGNKSVREFVLKIPKKIFWIIRDLTNLTAVRYFNQGQGMVDDILVAMNTNLEDFYLLGVNTFDDLKAVYNYQFVNEKVLDGGLVAMGIATDNDILADRETPVKFTGKKLKVKKGWHDYWIDELDGEVFVTKYFKEIGGDPAHYIEQHIGRQLEKTYYHIMGFEQEGIYSFFPPGFFFGNSMGTNVRIKTDEIGLYITSSKEYLNCLQKYLSSCRGEEIYFALLTGVGTLPGMFSGNLEILRESLLQQGISNFLLVFVPGEHFKTPGENIQFGCYSLTKMFIKK